MINVVWSIESSPWHDVVFLCYKENSSFSPPSSELESPAFRIFRQGHLKVLAKSIEKPVLVKMSRS
jgi:hypothetical protein